MKLSLLMIGLTQRPWQAMADNIHQQAAAFPGHVEFLACIDNGEMRSGAKRQQLAQSATGDYVAWVDDDDRVSDDYVRQLLQAIESDADVIGITLQFERAGVVHETWRFGLWPDQRAKGLMAANHLCAWKRDIANRVSWTPELSYGDDQAWYGPLIAAGVAKTCHRIEPVLYHYCYNPKTTVNQAKQAVNASRKYWGSGLGCYRDADGSLYLQCGFGSLEARGPTGERRPHAGLSRFTTIKLK